MRSVPNDIPVLSDERAAYLRSLTVAEKFAIMNALWEMRRKQVRDRVRSRQPDLSEAELDRAVARQMPLEEE